MNIFAPTAWLCQNKSSANQIKVITAQIILYNSGFSLILTHAPYYVLLYFLPLIHPPCKHLQMIRTFSFELIK